VPVSLPLSWADLARLTELQKAQLLPPEVLGGPPIATIYRLNPSEEGLLAAVEPLGGLSPAAADHIPWTVPVLTTWA
jgi:hypothetical protein